MVKSKLTNGPANFQEAFEQLEKLVSEFETGTIQLEDALEKFEKGLSLAAFCKKRLADIELRVVDIKKKFKDLDLEEE